MTRRKRRSDSKRPSRTAFMQSVVSCSLLHLSLSFTTVNRPQLHWRYSHPVLYGISLRRRQSSAASAAHGLTSHLHVSLKLQQQCVQHSIHRLAAEPLVEIPTLRSENEQVSPRCASAELLHQKMGVCHAGHATNGVGNFSSSKLSYQSDFPCFWSVIRSISIDTLSRNMVILPSRHLSEYLWLQCTPSDSVRHGALWTLAWRKMASVGVCFSSDKWDSWK